MTKRYVVTANVEITYELRIDAENTEEAHRKAELELFPNGLYLYQGRY
jgi:hypothetical protein